MGRLKTVTGSFLLISAYFWAANLRAADVIALKGGISGLKSSILGQVELQFPAGAFSKPQPIQLSVTQSKETANDFESSLLAPPERFKRLPGEIRIRTLKAKPRSNTKAKIVISPNLLQKGQTPEVMAEFFYSSETEVHDTFERIKSQWNPLTRELSFELEPDAFTDEKSSDGTAEAVVVIVFDQQKKSAQ